MDTLDNHPACGRKFSPTCYERKGHYSVRHLSGFLLALEIIDRIICLLLQDSSVAEDRSNSSLPFVKVSSIKKLWLFLATGVLLTFVSPSQRTTCFIHNRLKEWSEKKNKEVILFAWSTYSVFFFFGQFRFYHLPIVIGLEVLVWRHETEVIRRFEERLQKYHACIARVRQQLSWLNFWKHLALHAMGIIPEQKIFELCTI
jgi:hypothetical protein